MHIEERRAIERRAAASVKAKKKTKMKQNETNVTAYLIQAEVRGIYSTWYHIVVVTRDVWETFIHVL